MTAFEQVRQWSRRDLSALAQSMDTTPELAQSFQRWREARRGARARVGWLGGAGPSAAGNDGTAPMPFVYLLLFIGALLLYVAYLALRCLSGR